VPPVVVVVVVVLLVVVVVVARGGASVLVFAWVVGPLSTAFACPPCAVDPLFVVLPATFAGLDVLGPPETFGLETFGLDTFGLVLPPTFGFGAAVDAGL
jgi:hypothetical protein